MANMVKNHMLEAIRLKETTGAHFNSDLPDPHKVMYKHRQIYMQRNVHTDTTTYTEGCIQTYPFAQNHEHTEICIGTESYTHRQIYIQYT